MKELQELRNEVLSLRNMGELTKQTESILLHKLNALQEAINYTRCCEELKDKAKLNFGSWKFSQGLIYMSDFTYKNAKGELFDADVVNNTYNDYYNL